MVCIDGFTNQAVYGTEVHCNFVTLLNVSLDQKFHLVEIVCSCDVYGRYKNNVILEQYFSPKCHFGS